jgi:hypothetical protein
MALPSWLTKPRSRIVLFRNWQLKIERSLPLLARMAPPALALFAVIAQFSRSRVEPTPRRSPPPREFRRSFESVVAAPPRIVTPLMNTGALP